MMKCKYIRKKINKTSLISQLISVDIEPRQLKNIQWINLLLVQYKNKIVQMI